MDANPSGNVDGFILLHPIHLPFCYTTLYKSGVKCRVDSVADFEGKSKPFVMGQSKQGRLAHFGR